MDKRVTKGKVVVVAGLEQLGRGFGGLVIGDAPEDDGQPVHANRRVAALQQVEVSLGLQ